MPWGTEICATRQVSRLAALLRQLHHFWGRDPGLAAPVSTPVIAAKRPIQVRRFRALPDVRVVNSSILERNSLRIGEVFALL
jgi:hypothetical protein